MAFIFTSIEYTVDVLSTLSGIGNLAKLRHITKLTKLGKAIKLVKKGRAIIEITSGTTNALLKLTGETDTKLGKALSEYLFYLEILSLSVDVTEWISKGLKKSAKEVLEHSDALEKEIAKLIKKGEIDSSFAEKIFSDLGRIAEEAGDYSARLAKKASKAADKVSKKISDFETTIKKLDYEDGKLVNNANKIEIKHTGKKYRSSINWNHIPKLKFKGSTLTHNHPSGSGLSLTDVKLFLKTELREIRAITPNGSVYSMKNLSISNKYKEDLLDLIKKEEKIVQSEYKNLGKYYQEAIVFKKIYNEMKDMVEYTFFSIK